MVGVGVYEGGTLFIFEYHLVFGVSWAFGQLEGAAVDFGGVEDWV